MPARALWPALAALLAASCVSETKLQPLPSAPTTRSGAVTTEAEGVRLVADGDAWRGSPSNLENLVTPVAVRLENQSGRPLRIQQEDFTLQGESGFRYAALPPLELKEEGLGVGGSGQVSFGVGVGMAVPWAWAPGPFPSTYGWGPWGPGWYDPFFHGPWHGPWNDPWYGPYGYGSYGPYVGGYWYPPPEPLPTRDMLRQALPEGTLEEGGTIAGFLYFQGVSEREGHVTLQARLVDANTGEQFGTLSIPFEVRS
jgi:hypothetical protein